MKGRSYPAWICDDCGRHYGRVITGHCATYHEGDACGWCGRDDVAVTEPRDFGYPRAKPGPKFFTTEQRAISASHRVFAVASASSYNWVNGYIAGFESAKKVMQRRAKRGA